MTIVFPETPFSKILYHTETSFANQLIAFYMTRLFTERYF